MPVERGLRWGWPPGRATPTLRSGGRAATQIGPSCSVKTMGGDRDWTEPRPAPSRILENYFSSSEPIMKANDAPPASHSEL
jgi:hypothetical protein